MGLLRAARLPGGARRLLERRPGLCATRVRFLRFACFCAAAALEWMAGAPRAGAEQVEGPPPWHAGGHVGFTVDAVAFPESTGASLEVYVRVHPITLALLQRDLEGAGRLRVTARIRGAYGGAAMTAAEEFTVSPDDTTRGFGKVVLLRVVTRPGPHRIQVRLDDLNSRKRGLFYLGREIPRSSEVQGEFDVPAAVGGRRLSSLEFIWEEDSAAVAGPFTRGGIEVIPNPERLYGLLAPNLRIRFVAHDQGADDGAWHWQARLSDPEGRTIAERQVIASPGPWLRAIYEARVDSFAAGAYGAELWAWREGSTDTLLRRSKFSIAHRVETWARNPRDLEDRVHFLLSAEGEEDFLKMAPGEQERHLEQFWLLRDPTPGTPTNEARDEFQRRFEIANRTYPRRGPFGGMISDMARAFIRYGEPNEIVHQVVPAGTSTLKEILGDLSASESRPLDDIFQRGLGGDMRPYEVWIYEGEIPLPPDADPRVPRNNGRTRLVFLFVDDQGAGDYRLRYSTE